jgi:hypothetical protein
MVTTLRKSAPEVNAATLIATEATQIRDLYTAEQVPEIIAAYMVGIRAALAISIAGNGIGFFVGLSSSLKRLGVEA